MVKELEPLYYLHRIKNTPHNTRMRTELVEVCGFSTDEAKKTLYALENYVKIIINIPEDKRDQRMEFLRADLHWNGFRYGKLKNNPCGHVMINFFNHLVLFAGGVIDHFDKLGECIFIDRANGLYGFNGIGI